jgi:acetyl-CoA acetyltransferase
MLQDGGSVSLAVQASPGYGSNVPPVAIVGIGETAPVRRSGRSPADLVYEAVFAALADAGLTGSDVDGVLSEGSLAESTVASADIAHVLHAPEHAMTAQVSIGGAGIVASPLLAASLLHAGLASTVVCYFGATWGTDPCAPARVHTSDRAKATFELPVGFAGQPIYFAAMAKRYAHEYGLDAEDLAGIVLATRKWAMLHPQALKREPVEMTDYLRSPVIAEPLRVMDCCLLTDGAAAFVMTSMDRARDCAKPVVRVAGCALSRAGTSLHDYFTQLPEYLSGPAKVSGPRALGQAGVGIGDLDFAELYDCFSITPIMQMEDLGVCGRGEAAAFVRESRTAPGGQLPVNTHGGLLAHSYIGGINHVIEGVRQMRGQALGRQVEGASVGIVTGYSANEHATMVLTK